MTKTDYKNISVAFYRDKQKIIVSVCNKTIRFAEYFDSLFLYNGPYFSPHPYFGHIPKLIQPIDEPEGVFIEFRTLHNKIAAPSRASAFRRAMSFAYSTPATRYIFPQSCAEKELLSYKSIKNLITPKNANIEGKIEYRIAIILYKDKAAFADNDTADKKEYLSPWFELDEQ